jgi:predicted transcriptional regulator
MNTTSIRVDKDQYEAIQAIAMRRGLKIIQVLRKALARYIATANAEQQGADKYGWKSVLAASEKRIKP